MAVLIKPFAAAAVSLITVVGSAMAQDKFITVASTTSTESSGLFDYLLPMFKRKTGVDVRVIPQGTGQALETGRRGDADVLFVHDPAAEKAFVEEGAGVKRFQVMYNDFVIVGPNNDPAGIKGMRDAVTAFAKIAKAKTSFASRGDNSGTHKAELRYWKGAAIIIKTIGRNWYRELGAGMGATLNTAAQMRAYTLVDRGSWISFKNKGPLQILVEGDPKLFNQYGVILVNPEKHPHVKKEAGAAFINWLISKEGQQAIADYKLKGRQLFFPNANKGAS